jgi:hypothetical protein
MIGLKEFNEIFWWILKLSFVFKNGIVSEQKEIQYYRYKANRKMTKKIYDSTKLRPTKLSILSFLQEEYF